MKMAQGDLIQAPRVGIGDSVFENPPWGDNADGLKGVVCREPVEEAVLRLINRERAKHGRARLSTSRVLWASAQAWTRMMIRADLLAHEIDGVSWTETIRSLRYPTAWLGQNVAIGYETPEAVVAAWMDSPGPRGTILTEKFAELGVGHAIDHRGWHWWTTNHGGAKTPVVERC